MNPELNSRVETRDVHRNYVMIAVASLIVLLMLGVTTAWLLYRQQIRAQLGTAPQYSTSAFPIPRLQAAPAELLVTLHAEEEKKLKTYAWIDDHHQTAQLPIDRVLQLAVKKHLIPSQRSPSDAR